MLHLTIDRSKKSAPKKLNNLLQPLKSGIPVMLFPEVHDHDGSLQPFKNGAFLLALEHGLCIQPLVIEGAFEVLRSGEFTYFDLKPISGCEFFQALILKEFESMSELKHTVQERMSDALKELESV